MSRWHLITGEYPPGSGGIGDYTRLLADALAERGEQVDVWTSSAVPDSGASSRVAENGVAQATDPAREPRVHRISALHGAGLRQLSAGLDAAPAPRRLLIQYAPQAMGLRGLNVAFCAWALARRRAGDDVRVMFHEPFFPFGWQRPQRNLLAAVNRVMATLLLRASTRAYVSTHVWEPLLRPLAPPGLTFTDLPIPSNIPVVDRPDLVRLKRAELSEDGRRPVYVHFGTYGELITQGLCPTWREVLKLRPTARILLLGRGGPAYADRLVAEDGGFAEALITPGYLEPTDVSIHLQACDAALQWYPDGADTRRTTLMACLANGVPTVTSRGPGSGSIIFGPVMHAAPRDWPALAERLVGVGDSPAIRVADVTGPEFRQMIRDHYEASFSMARTVERLLANGDGAP